jgi:hypothetical protein
MTKTTPLYDRLISLYVRRISLYDPTHTVLATQENSSEVRLFPFEHGRRWGYYDDHGRIVIRPQFSNASKFREGVAAVAVDVVEKGRGKVSKYGYISPEGRFVIPAKYDSAGPFSNGLAAVGVNGKDGYIDKSGARQGAGSR